MIDDLPDDPKLTERIRSVFKKAWTAFPDRRYCCSASDRPR